GVVSTSRVTGGDEPKRNSLVLRPVVIQAGMTGESDMCGRVRPLRPAVRPAPGARRRSRRARPASIAVTGHLAREVRSIASRTDLVGGAAVTAALRCKFRTM